MTAVWSPLRVKSAVLAVGRSLPVCPDQRTSRNAVGMSEKCPKPVVATLFDHLIGAGKQRWRDVEAERLGGLEIEDELEFGGPFDRDVAGFRAL
jgi:hypothetical protein